MGVLLNVHFSCLTQRGEHVAAVGWADIPPPPLPDKHYTTFWLLVALGKVNKVIILNNTRSTCNSTGVVLSYL